MNIIELAQSFELLSNTASINDKKALLSCYLEDDDFKMTITFLLNPYITTGIGEKSITKCATSIQKTATLKETIDYVVANNTGSQSTVEVVCGFIEANLACKEFLNKLFTKTLKCGVDAKTVNAVKPHTIPVFEIQLGTPIEKCTIPDGAEMFISQKLNGCRCVYHKGKLYTRTGREYTGLSHIIESLNYLHGMTLDGELIRKNIDGVSDSENFQIGAGIANSKLEDKTCLKYVVFDIMTDSEFESQQSTRTYGDRKQMLLETIREDENVEIVPFFESTFDHDRINYWLNYAEKNDMEGIMINLDVPYQFKRTKSLIKVKKFYTLDLECINIEEGEGKNLGTLGSIVCKYGDNIVKVGSGLTDEQRNHYWNNPSEIIGRIIEVKYKEITQNKNGGISVQFPVFCGVRFDKEVGDVIGKGY